MKVKHRQNIGLQHTSLGTRTLGECCCTIRLKALILSFGVIFCTIYFLIITPPSYYEDTVHIPNGLDLPVNNGSGGVLLVSSYSLNREALLRASKRPFNNSYSNLTSGGNEINLRQVTDSRRVMENDGISILSRLNTSVIRLNKTAFGGTYKPSEKRSSQFDFPFVINGKDVCFHGSDPYLVIMVLSVHTHVDTRTAIRKTWGRAANPGVWPKVGEVKPAVKLIFLFGNAKTELGNKIIKEESKIYGDIVQADFEDSYFNLTYKTVMGIRWVVEFCPKAKYILKADEDVFVHVYNLLNFLSKREEKSTGVIYGHALHNSDVFREGRWSVSKSAFPLNVYPTYTCGNTYVISGNMAANIFYTAGVLPYLNIEDVFVTGIVRTFLNAELVDVIGFTHWFEKKPKPCEFKNSIRISATKVSDLMQYDIWEGLKTKEADCYKVVRTKHIKTNRPERGPKMTQMIRDEHIFMNKTSGQFYVL